MSPGGPFDTFGTDSGDETGVGETGEPACEGSVLENIPDDPAECDAPPSPTDDCEDEPAKRLFVFGPQEVIQPETPATQEAEMAALVDLDGNEYVATQVLEWAPGSAMGLPATCLVQREFASTAAWRAQRISISSRCSP
jgi:hypothetical protein